jgi:hypothetical protein
MLVEVRLVAGEAVDARPVGDVLVDRLRERVGLLEHHADAGAQLHHVDRLVVDVLPVEADVALGPADLDGVVHPVDAAQEGRLAAAGRADEGGHLVGPDVDVDVEQRLLVAVPEIDLARGHLALAGSARRRRSRGGAVGGHRGGIAGVGCYHFVRNLCRRKTAVAFMRIRKPSSTMIAAEVRATKPRSGLSNQMKICVGRAVAGSSMPRGLVMKAFMPISSSGRGLAQRLGQADDGAGQDARHGQRQDVVGHRLQPRGADAERRFPDRGRHRFSAARVAMMMVGRVIREHHAADQGAERGRPKNLEEDGEAQQAEDDRGHGGQVVDVDLDQVGPAVLGRELLEIDRRRDAERESLHGDGGHRLQRVERSGWR